MASSIFQPFSGPEVLAVADWRRQVQNLYAQVRTLAAQEPGQAWQMWRDTRRTLFAEHPASPLSTAQLDTFSHLPLYDYDPKWRLAVGVEPVEGGELLQVDLGEDGAFSYRCIGRTLGLTSQTGAELNLYWIEGYGGGLFLPFLDATSGVSTYGGGRYLYDAIKGSDLGQNADGELVLDFNFAYNPSCCWNPRWVCPLAAEENRLPQPVLAGEQAVLP